MLALPPFLRAAHLGVYVHCAKLREVDTGAILAAAMRLRKVCYVPVVDDRASNMSLLHLDALACLVPAPPLNILEPPRTYSDGRPRADALQENHAATIDVLITPGLAFDSAGRRLGRGGGYYDKAIGLLRERARARGAPPPLLVALAYRAQMVAHVPTDAHDQVVDVVVTADGALACSPYAEQLLLAPASHQQQPI